MIARSSEEVKEFLVSLEKLCSDHGMVIWGCGCCDSPRIEYCKKGSKLNYEVTYGENESFLLKETTGAGQ